MSAEPKDFRVALTPDIDAALTAVVTPERKDFRPQVSRLTELALLARAQVEQRHVDDITAMVLNEWAERHVESARDITAAMESLGAREPSDEDSEKSVELWLEEELNSNAFNVERQVNTSAGTADLVIHGRCVIEVKKAILNWRDVHAACGQSLAYAEALGLTEAIVCAPDIEPRFCGERIGAQVMQADQVVAYLEGPKANAVSIYKRG